jgi:hypothetical protein
VAAVLLFRAMSDSFSNSTPQFGTAEYANTPLSTRCQFCQQPIHGSFYRVNAAVACAGCAEQMRTGIDADRHAAYVRAVAFGIGAAVIGLVGYALIAILLQGWVISYMSIGVGWLVGTAMMKGSNGIGGRRYQIVAALLTYAAVSMAAIPIWIHFAPEQGQQQRAQQQRQQQEQRQFENEERKFGQDAGQQPPEPQPAPVEKRQVSVFSVVRWIGRLALLGLASPFIQISGNPFWGAMGILILFFGIRIAWRITEGREFGISGPFVFSPPPVSP